MSKVVIGDSFMVDDTKYVKAREPLSDDEITTNTPKLISIGERLAFTAGIKFAEKVHGIGGGE
jgi:hypothetical protein